MNIQKVEQELLKGIQNQPGSREHGFSYKLPDDRTVIFAPDGARAFVWSADTFHLSEKYFPFIERMPIKPPELKEDTLLLPTGMETRLNNGKTPALIFQHPDGGKTYLNKSFLTPFDKGSRLYQEHSHTGGRRDWAVVAVAETNRITGELETVGYIMPMRGPEHVVTN